MATFPGIFSKSEIRHCCGSSRCVWAAEAQHFLRASRERSCCTTSPEPPNTPDTNCTQHPQLQDKLFQASTGKLRLIYAVAARNDRAAASAAEGWRGEQWVCQHSPSWVQIQKQACCLLLWKYHSTGSHLRIYMDSSSNRITVFGTESLPKECTMYPEIPRNHDYIYSQNNPLFQVLAMV